MMFQPSLDLLRKRKRMAISRQNLAAVEAAEIVAIQALGFIAQDEERLGRFLAVTGMGPAEIRAGARERHFLAGLLDYLMGDETLLVQFAGHAEIDPTTIVIARRALSEAGEDGEA
jgi:hypothetical protein